MRLGAREGTIDKTLQRDCHNLECRSQDQTPPVGHRAVALLIGRIPHRATSSAIMRLPITAECPNAAMRTTWWKSDSQTQVREQHHGRIFGVLAAQDPLMI